MCNSVLTLCLSVKQKTYTEEHREITENHREKKIIYFGASKYRFANWIKYGQLGPPVWPPLCIL